jgi:uncharacterized membrane protein YfcA
MEFNLLFLITVVPAILLFGISKAGLGGSVALISIPLVMPFTDALAITLPILILADFVAVYKFRKEFDLDTLKLISIGAFIGIIIGALTFKFFSEDVLKLIVGLMGFSFTFHYFFLKKNKYLAIPKSKLKGSFFSIISGFTSFCVHSGGTPLSVYLLPLRIEKAKYVGTRVLYFTFVNLVKLPIYIYLSMINIENLKLSFYLMPLVVLGVFIGYQLVKIIEEKLFYNIIYVLIFVSSSKLIFDFFN